jgi:hypothetical protein
MSKGLTAGLLLLSLLSSTSVTYGAMSCEDLFNGLGHANRAGSYAERLIEAQISAIKSVETLAQFFEVVGGIGPANHEHAVRMAELFYRELGQQGVERIARNLLLNHRHVSQEAVWSAFMVHARGESSGAASLERYFPEATNKETFLRWTRLGERLTADSKFMSQLELALRDFKAFESVYGESINAERAFVSVVEGLKGLNEPSLIGRFIEFFGKADRLTRQYIFDEVMQLTRLDGREITVVVKGSSSKAERNASAKALGSIFEKSMNQLQEEAYFVYKSNGISNRPQLPDAETTKVVALRYLKRMNYALIEGDVEYASEVLARHPSADPAIDMAMVKLLEMGATMPERRHIYSDDTYAMHELRILARNARGLSAINIDLRYGAQVLSSKTDDRLYLGDLLEFHAKYDLRNFPALQRIATTYFRKYPESLSDLHESQYANALKFRRDFGI